MVGGPEAAGCVMAKKAPARRAPSKRKPRPKKPVVPADGSIEFSEFSPETLERLKEILDRKEAAVDTFDSQVGWKILSSLKHLIPCVLSLVIGAAAGVYAAGGIEIGPDGGGKQDVLSDAYKADRATQVKVLRELAEQPFDGATSDGKKKAGEWFNANRFRTRADDYREFTNEVSEAIAANAEAKLADELEAK